MSLIHSMLGEVRSFLGYAAVADRGKGDCVNRWSPYVLTHKVLEPKGGQDIQ